MSSWRESITKILSSVGVGETRCARGIEGEVLVVVVVVVGWGEPDGRHDIRRLTQKSSLITCLLAYLRTHSLPYLITYFLLEPSLNPFSPIPTRSFPIPRQPPTIVHPDEATADLTLNRPIELAECAIDFLCDDVHLLVVWLESSPLS